jgi:phosphopantothenoylcysteine decarboxylase/phosphopantothenate--cysteine ligase
MEFATGNPVVTEITGFIEHVELAGDHENKADLILVCPATANTIGKIACGIDDTPVTTVVTTAFAHTPIMIAPAMHSTMYEHPIVLENIEKLKNLGVEFIGPRFEEGKAKVASVDEVVYRVIRKLHPKTLRGKRVLVTAGATREYIDPIRYITNASSGKMGVAMAEEADFRGAEVTLIRTKGSVPSFVENQLEVETVEEMLRAIENELKTKKYDVVILAAAVSDFRVKNRAETKIKSGRKLTLELEPTPKIIERIKALQPGVFLVGFKAETSEGNLIEEARKQIERAGSDLVVANTLKAFGSPENEVILVSREEVKKLPKMNKRELAERLWDEIEKRIKP